MEKYVGDLEIEFYADGRALARDRLVSELRKMADHMEAIPYDTVIAMDDDFAGMVGGPHGDSLTGWRGLFHLKRKTE